jgi:hypothetical protein
MADEFTPRRDQPPRRSGDEFEGAGDNDFRHRDPGYNRGSGGGGGGGENPVVGWIIFILIFGVGNFILYSTTGIFIIPIRR